MDPAKIQLKAEQYYNSSYTKEKGTIHYEVCPVCGYTQIAMIQPKEPGKVISTPMDPSRCSACYDIKCRYPELYGWLAGVFFMQVSNKEYP